MPPSPSSEVQRYSRPKTAGIVPKPWHSDLIDLSIEIISIEVLALAPSTVDNHKSRLMKKLGVHKSLDLNRLAIREGLVSI